MKENKELTDKQLVEKYEAREINLPAVLEIFFENHAPIKCIVSDRVKKKTVSN